MADKNRNGIPDDQEKGFDLRGLERRGTAGYVKPQAQAQDQGGSFWDNPWLTPWGAAGQIHKGIEGVARSAAPYLAAAFAPKAPAMRDRGSRITAATDPRMAAIARAKQSGGAGPNQQAAPEKTLADYLAMATELIGSGGAGGGIPGVNYDPQRNAARANAAENDARLEAMYRQLRGSIQADAPVIQQGYQSAIDATAKNATDAQQQTQAATDSANSRNNEVLANLGIQQAQGNIIQNGTDLNTQTAQRMADQATKGQAAGDRLVSNQQTALTHNTNIGNAAGLEGNLQRASNNARLQALLAEIDMKQQQDNQAVAAQNASSSQSGIGQQLQLAQYLMGNATDERRYQDSLQAQGAKLAIDQQAALGKSALPDLGAYLQALGINPQDIAKSPEKYGSLLSSLQNFGVQK